MSTKNLTPVSASYRVGLGPYEASMVHDGDYVELSNGYRVQCSPAGGDHGASNLSGGMVLKTDPQVHEAAVDLGIEFNGGKNLRAPDVAVGENLATPGWAQKMPPLCVEYAARGQNEGDLQVKIQELLEQGVKYIWVVRLVGPLRVEVYERGQPMRVVMDGEELRAPGVLKNSYAVRDLVDSQAANETTLRNLLNRKGYPSLDEALARSLKEGMDLGLNEVRQALLDLCEVLGIEVTAERHAALAGMDLTQLGALRVHLKQQRAWPAG